MAGLLAGSLRAHQPPPRRPPVGSPVTWPVSLRCYLAPHWALPQRPPRYARVDTWSRPPALAVLGGRNGDTDLSWLRRHRQPRRSDLLHLRHEPAPARPGGGGDDAAHSDAGVPAFRRRGA